MRRRVFLPGLFLLLVLPAALVAQTGSVKGTVVDPDGNPILVDQHV